MTQPTPSSDNRGEHANDAHAQRLEDWAQQLCQSQPNLRAPDSLHDSVMTALERRARQWWCEPALHWPWWANAAMLMLCAFSMWWLVAGLSVPSDWLSVLLNTTQVLHDLLWMVVNQVPLLWSLAAGGCLLAIAMGVAGLRQLTLR